MHVGDRMKLTIMHGNIFDQLPKVPTESIDLVITSPPYWGLRDYGVEGQLGLEPTMELYLENTMRWVKEVWRVLKPTGSFVLNIGDCFVGNGRYGTPSNNKINPNYRDAQPKNFKWPYGRFYKKKQLISVSSFAYCRIINETDFVCRGEHIWAKSNVPTPIRSRLKHSHEKLFWFVKDANKYYFDKKPWMKKVSEISHERSKYAVNIEHFNSNAQDESTRLVKYPEETIEHSWRIIPIGARKSGFEMEGKRPLRGHIAPFPEKLIRPYIQSLCPTEGIILDPFLGSGTTMRVAMEEGRNCMGIELKETYIELTKKRLNWGHGLNVEYEEVK